jgi:hypothetical protein
MATVVRGGRWADDTLGNTAAPAISGLTAAAAHETGDDVDADSASSSIMALVLQRSHLGIAIYNEAESELLWSQ